MSRRTGLYLLKQICIITMMLYAVNFVCNEYLEWNDYMDCQSKCHTLGLEKGRIQNTTFSEDVTLCRCLADSDYYVVLN